MSAATSGNEWMYDDPCNAKGAGCSEGGVVRNYGREAQKTRGRRKEKAGGETSTSGMVGARPRWSEERRLSGNIDGSGCIDYRYRGKGTQSIASAYVEPSIGSGYQDASLDCEWHELQCGFC